MSYSEAGASGESFPSFRLLKIVSCGLLLFFSVSGTIFTEASKLEDGTYPYNTSVIPCAVEAVKLTFSSIMLARERFPKAKVSGSLSFTLRSFSSYSLPAFCEQQLHILHHSVPCFFDFPNHEQPESFDNWRLHVHISRSKAIVDAMESAHNVLLRLERMACFRKGC